MKKSILILTLLAIFALTLSACTNQAPPDSVDNGQDTSNVCTQEQKEAEICTLEYAPVCGDDGQTYGNKCAACASQKVNVWTPGECPIEVIDFETCVATGNAVMESYPRQCAHEGVTYVEELPLANETQTFCTQEQKEAEICTREYMPVCGDDGVTYSNPCTACSSKNIDSYTFEACLDDSTNGSQAGGTVPADTPTSQLCEGFGGNWIDSANECEGISQETCQEIGGQFNECASACRNNPDAEVCTQQCVLVCEFD